MKYFDLLRGHGNNFYNKSNPDGKIIVKRRIQKNTGDPIPHLAPTVSSEKKSGEGSSIKPPCTDPDFILPCKFCKEFIRKKYLTKHIETRHPEKCKYMSVSGAVNAGRKEFGRVNPLATTKTRKVFSSLRADNIGDVCRADELIVLFANDRSEKLGLEDQRHSINTNCRYLAKLLLKMKSYNPDITDLESAFRGHKWKYMLRGLKSICGYDDKKQRVNSSFIANNYVILIRRCADILEGKTNEFDEENEDAEKLRKLRGFRVMLKRDFNSHIGRKATLTLNADRRAKAVTEKLPIPEDIDKFTQFIDDKLAASAEYVQKKMSLWNKMVTEQWKTIGMCLLVKFMSWNRRRPGEVDRLTLEDYKNFITADEDDPYYKVLNKNDKKQYLKYHKLRGQGKRADGIDATIYMTENEKQILDLYVKCRKKAGINKHNDFLFAIPQSIEKRLRHLGAYQSLIILRTEYAEKCQLKYPERILSTKLRKDLVTALANIAKKDHHDDVTRHMAHSKKVRDDRYKLSRAIEDVHITKTLETIRMSKRNMEQENNNLEVTNRKSNLQLFLLTHLITSSLKIRTSIRTSLCPKGYYIGSPIGRPYGCPK